LIRPQIYQEIRDRKNLGRIGFIWELGFTIYLPPAGLRFWDSSLREQNKGIAIHHLKMTA